MPVLVQLLGLHGRDNVTQVKRRIRHQLLELCSEHVVEENQK
jgi:hypothetical protein